MDVTLREVLDQPRMRSQVDRVRAATFGISQQDASRSILSALGSGGTVSPNFWSDPVTGSSYDVQVIAPPDKLDSIDDILNLVVRPSFIAEGRVCRFAPLPRWWRNGLPPRCRAA